MMTLDTGDYIIKIDKSTVILTPKHGKSVLTTLFVLNDKLDQIHDHIS